MIFQMNGKPVWCPRPHRKDAKAPICDPDELKQTKTTLLSEMPALIAAAIKAGLVQRPGDYEQHAPSLRADRPNVWTTCDTCHERFERGMKSKLTTCLSCRLEPIACKVCGKMFRRHQRKQQCCTLECAHAVARNLALERAKKRVHIECVACGKPHPLRFHGGKPVQTCGRECAKKLQKKLAEKKYNK